MRLPLFLYNDGATPIVVEQLRVTMARDQAEEGPSFSLQAIHPSLYGPNEDRQFATGFSVPGRGTVERTFEFQRFQWSPVHQGDHGDYSFTLHAKVFGERRRVRRWPDARWVSLLDFRLTGVVWSGQLVPRDNRATDEPKPSRKASMMLKISDIPDEFRKGKTDGENLARLASGVQQALAASHGPPGNEAGLRLVQAGFHFRSCEIGWEMARRAAQLQKHLTETDQLIEFAAGTLAATSLAAAIDLSAAALRRLYLGPVSSSDPGREADVHNFPDEDKLPNAAQAWLLETRIAHQWGVLKEVRDHFVHRHFPIHVTISLGGGPGFQQELEVAGQRRRVQDFLMDSREFVMIDSFRSDCSCMRSHKDRGPASRPRPANGRRTTAPMAEVQGVGLPGALPVAGQKAGANLWLSWFLPPIGKNPPARSTTNSTPSEAACRQDLRWRRTAREVPFGAVSRKARYPPISGGLVGITGQGYAEAPMTGPTNQDRYKEYWAYLRHIETLRFTMGGLIVTVASALLAVVYLAPGGGISEDLKPWALVFLSLLVGVAAWFLVAHKKSYSHYFAQLQNMDESLKDFAKGGPFKVLLALITLPLIAVVGSAFAFDSWERWERVLVMVIGVMALLSPWVYHYWPDAYQADQG